MDIGLFALMVIAGTLGAALGTRISRIARRRARKAKSPAPASSEGAKSDQTTSDPS